MKTKELRSSKIPSKRGGEDAILASLSASYSEFGIGMNKYSLYKVNDPALSQDLVQDSFLRTFNYLRKGGKVKLMKAFLYHVLNNLIIDEYRKHKTVSLDSMLENGYEPRVDDTERLFDTLDGKAALKLIAELPVKYHEVMRMRYGQMLSIEEIADKTAQTKNTVAVQLHRGLEKLQALYANRLTV